MRFADGWGIVTPTSDHDFAGMCRALGVDGYDDPRVATIAERRQHGGQMSKLIDQCYTDAAATTMAEATNRFEAERVPFAMILSPRELIDDAHAVAAGLFEVHDHHVVGRARHPRHPTQFGATPATLRLDSPALGQHTDEILADLGLRENVADYRARGIVA